MSSRGASGGRTTTTVKLAQAVVALPRLGICLEQEAGVACRREVELDGAFLRVGSHASNDLVIDDPEVSRFHFTLTRTGAAWRLADLGSTNGTFVGELRVRDADVAGGGSSIRVGASVLSIRPMAPQKESTVSARASYGALFGASLTMRNLYDAVARVARSECDVLIQGESGTGKELVAGEIVRSSARADKPMVIVDCGAISPSLIESELFGHARGAFTGAVKDRAGAFECAQGGTLFLDEIGELPKEVQPKLLRALAAREVRRVGETHARHVNVRVIAATNRELEREVNAGRFREDVYYRLATIVLRVPPLRDRLEDIDLLVAHLTTNLDASAKQKLFGADVIAEMRRYNWPGNVRELRSFVERRIVFEEQAGPPVTPSTRGASDDDDVAEPLYAPASAVTPEVADEARTGASFREAKEEVISRFERAYLTKLLAACHGNVSQAAREARLDRMHLHRLLQRYGLRRGARLPE